MQARCSARARPHQAAAAHHAGAATPAPITAGRSGPLSRTAARLLAPPTAAWPRVAAAAPLPDAPAVPGRCVRLCSAERQQCRGSAAALLLPAA